MHDIHISTSSLHTLRLSNCTSPQTSLPPLLCVPSYLAFCCYRPFAALLTVEVFFLVTRTDKRHHILPSSPQTHSLLWTAMPPE